MKPEATDINDIDFDEIMQKAYKEIEKDEKRQLRNRHRALSCILKIKGSSFVKDVIRFMNDPCDRTDSYHFVRKTIGEYQKENLSFEGCWISQHCTGMEGDSFAGTVCIQIKKNRYFKFSYSC